MRRIGKACNLSHLQKDNKYNKKFGEIKTHKTHSWHTINQNNSSVLKKIKTNVKEDNNQFFSPAITKKNEIYISKRENYICIKKRSQTLNPKERKFLE